MSKAPIFSILLSLSFFSLHAVAENGWVLVVPPKIQQMTDSEIDWLNKSTAAHEDRIDGALYHGDAILDKAAPIAEWRQIEAFENVTFCEEDRKFKIHYFKREIDKIREQKENHKPSLEKFEILLSAPLVQNARCVPANAYYGN